MSLPDWVQAPRRRDTVRRLFQSQTIDPALWRLLFQSRSESAPCRGETQIDAWQVDWAHESVVFRFKRGDAFTFRHVASPATTRIGERAFAVQRDAYLCGLHSLNTVAGATLLNPAALFEILCRMRPVDPSVTTSLYAQREEIFVAALREGVVLGSLLLSAASQLDALRRQQYPTPPNAAVEAAVRAAGGMFVLFSSSAGCGGHYVSVVTLGYRWALYDTHDVVGRYDTLGDALLDALIRRAEPNREVVGLIPLVSDDRVTHMWRNCVLRNTTVAQLAVNTPIFSPLDVHAAAIGINLSPAYPINAFTLLTARTRFETELSNKAEELARCLVTLDPVVRLNWAERASPSMIEALVNVPLNLVQLASLLRSWLGLLFVPRLFLPNREWLRYVALYQVARRLKLALEREQTVRFYQLAALVACIGFTWHRHAGQSRDELSDNYPAVNGLYSMIKGSEPDSVVSTIGDTTPFERRAAADSVAMPSHARFVMSEHYDRSLWLLYVAKHAGVEVGVSDEVLAHLDPGQHDGGLYGQDSVPSLDKLRDIAFLRPAAHGAPLDAAARRELLAPTFQRYFTLLDRPMLAFFGCSQRYADVVDHAAIAAEVDALPHLLEQALVLRSGDEMYGTVFDAEHEKRPVDPNQPICSRFELVGDRTSVMGYEPRLAAYQSTPLTDVGRPKRAYE